MEFSRQQYWSRLPFPSPEYLPNLGIKPRAPTLQAVSLPSELSGKSNCWLYMSQKKSCIVRTLIQSPLSPTHLFSHRLIYPSSCFHLENRSLHPQVGAGLTLCTLGLQRSLWEDVNSAPSLLQKRVTWDLLDPWSRAWSTGSVREAEGKPYRPGAETSPRTKAGSPEHRRQSSPLGCWGGDGAGRRGASAVLLSALTPLWLPSGTSSKMIFVAV